MKLNGTMKCLSTHMSEAVIFGVKEKEEVNEDVRRLGKSAWQVGLLISQIIYGCQKDNWSEGDTNELAVNNYTFKLVIIHSNRQTSCDNLEQLPTR